jgi:hypothetical protein
MGSKQNEGQCHSCVYQLTSSNDSPHPLVILITRDRADLSMSNRSGLARSFFVMLHIIASLRFIRFSTILNWELSIMFPNPGSI